MQPVELVVVKKRRRFLLSRIMFVIILLRLSRKIPLYQTAGIDQDLLLQDTAYSQFIVIVTTHQTHTNYTVGRTWLNNIFVKGNDIERQGNLNQ
jgi:hypothetical protein